MTLPPYMPPHQPREMNAQELADVLRVTLRFGTLLLRSGTTSSRVDEAMSRVALVLGVERIDNYVTPTGIITSVYSGREHRTQITHSTALSVDMNRVCELELMSRNLNATSTVESVNAAIEKIEKKPSLYTPLVVVIGTGLACGALALILGGGALDFVAATIGAGLAQYTRHTLVKAKIRAIPMTVMAAFVATLVSWILLRFLHPIVQPALDSIGMMATNGKAGIVASVLVLIPGVPMITAFLDLIRFDLLAGMARGVYAFILVVCIALGMLAVLIWTGFSVV
ncbi:MAG: threonine/serine exporter family protein [Anaerolineae bacterium]|nr:threonine/serine exporter family protein [Anaerolineae bacterium]